MYEQNTGIWQDGNLPPGESLKDGYGKREVGTYYTRDYIALLNRRLDTKTYEPDLEQ